MHVEVQKASAETRVACVLLLARHQAPLALVWALEQGPQGNLSHLRDPQEDQGKDNHLSPLMKMQTAEVTAHILPTVHRRRWWNVERGNRSQSCLLESLSLLPRLEDGLLARYLWNKMAGEEREMKARSDRSAARLDGAVRNLIKRKLSREQHRRQDWRR